MKLLIKDFFRKCDQIPKKPYMENQIFVLRNLFTFDK